MKKITPIYFLLLLFISPLFAQNEKLVDSLFAKSNEQFQNYQREESLVTLETIFPLIENGGDDEILLKYHYELSKRQSELGERELFVEASEKALSIVDKKMGGVHPLKYELLNTLINLNFFYDRPTTLKYLEIFQKHLDAHPDDVAQSNYERRLGSEKAREKKLYAAADIYERSLKKGGFYSSDDEIQAHTNLAYFYQMTGRNKKAFSVRLKALELLEKTSPPNHKRLGTVYAALAVASSNHRGIQSDLRAIKYAKKAKYHGGKAENENTEFRAMVSILKQNLELYQKTNEQKYWEDALIYKDSLFIVYEAKLDYGNPVNLPYGSEAYLMFADYYLKSKDKDAQKAREYYNKARAYESKYQGLFTRPMPPRNYAFRLANIELLEGNYTAALEAIQEVPCSLLPDWNGCGHLDSFPSPQKAGRGITSYAITNAKVYHSLFLEKGKPKYLDKTIRAYSYLDSLVILHGREVLKNNYGSRPYAEYGAFAFAEKYLLQKNEPIFFDALRCAEKQKSYNLLSQLFQTDIRRTSSLLPDSIKTKLGILKGEFDYLKSMADKKLLENTESANEFNLKRDKKEKEYLDYLAFTEKEFTDKGGFGNVLEATDINDLQLFSENTKNETVVEFSIGKENIYVFILDPKGNDIVKLNVNKDELTEQLEIFRNMLTENKNGIEGQAKKIYTSIFSPIKKLCTTDQLIIVPDAELAYLPFDLLMDENGEYLIENYSIRYIHSISWLQYENKKQRPKNNGEILAMASSPEMPAFAAILRDSVRDGLGHLPGAEKEVSVLKKHMSGAFLSDKNASESFFKNNAGKYGLLHMAMHAIIDEQVPSMSRLVFSQEENNSDAYLHGYEIYNLNLHADLVTLSACNSGYGEIKNGDGLQSLSTAFAYAGCPNSISSLWTVHDKSSAEIMDLFYQELLKDIPKHEALRNAKLEFFKSKPAALKHPYYWGGFVYYGDGKPIAAIEEKKWRLEKWGVLVLAGLVVVGLLSYIMKRGRTKTPT